MSTGKRGLLRDEDAPARLDLRLVPVALAVWAGSLAGLSGRLAVELATAASGLLLAAWAFRRGWAAGATTAVAGLLAGLAVAGLYWHAAESDPLVRAGGAGSWADLQASISGAPQLVKSSFPTTDDQAALGSAAPRWRVPASATVVSVAGRQWRPVAGVTIFAQGQAWGDLMPGATIAASGLLTPDTISVLPAVVLRARGAPTALAPAPWWQTLAGTVRHDLVHSASGLDPDASGLLPGLVVGDTSGISDSLSADAKATGLTHLLAVSGSHFAILCGAVVLVLRRVVGPRIAALGGSGVLVSLVVLVGPQASVLRAAVTGTITLAALLLGRTRSALPALAAAVILLLLVQPELARSAGFALSVQATGGLVLLAPVWSKGLQKRKVPAGWADLLAVPAAASVVTLPVIAALSGSVSLAGIPANLLAAPVVPIGLIIGVLSALAGPWWPSGARALAQADEPLLDWIAGVAHRMARWSSATVPWPASLPGVMLLTGLVVGALLALRHRRLRALAVAACTGVVVIVVPAQILSLGWPMTGWLLTACEVGQGDAMVLSTGVPGEGVVVDAGPDSALVDGCLDRLGISTVPLVILTHLHADHVDGLAGVLAGRSVGAIGVGPDRSSATAWQTINDLAASRGIPVVSLTPGTQWVGGELTLHVWGPTREFHGTDSDPNNDSVVTMAVLNGVHILMTGDIEVEAQQQLLDAGADLDADVLEQPHHGSAKFLPAFLAAVSPQVSLIGVGLGNDYGQPSPKSLDLLAASRVTVLRTDLQGDASVGLVDGQLTTTTRGAVLKASKSAAGSG